MSKRPSLSGSLPSPAASDDLDAKARGKSRKSLYALVSPDIHLRVRLACLREGTTVTALLPKLLLEWLDKVEKGDGK